VTRSPAHADTNTEVIMRFLNAKLSREASAYRRIAVA